MDPCYAHGARLLAQGVDLAPDSQGVPAPAARPELSYSGSPDLWLPPGHHWDLHIEHDHRVDTGSYASGAVPKMLWHITVSQWESVDAMRDVLHTKAAEVHFVIGGRAGTEHPVVIQCLPLNHYGKGCLHPSGTPETNRAGGVQVEICATVGSIASFTHYRALANLFVLVQHRVNVSNAISRSFSNSQRFSASGYMGVKGHHGHMHVPNNDHVDPTSGMKAGTLQRQIRDIPNGGWQL